MSQIDDLTEGETISIEKEPTREQLFRYSAITWNPHRIHYDPEYAQTEGHPDVLVQAHLHGGAIQELLMDWLGSDGRLTDLSWSNVGRALPDEPLHVGAEVTSVDEAAATVEFDVWTESENSKCAEGEAAVELFD